MIQKGEILGEIIGEKYKLISLLGEGGMSSVYLAEDLYLGKKWAVKVIKKSDPDLAGGIYTNNAMAEASLMKKLDHPSLPRIVDIREYGEYMYVVMDYIEGVTLGKVLADNGALPQDKVIVWAKKLCEVLIYLHSQVPPIIYRDMKPENIMLMPSGEIKLIDFGIAREYKSDNVKDTVCLGTKGYAAPEQFGGRGQSDARTDIYCFGVTIYHLVTGKNPCEPPYRLYPIRYINPGLSPGLESIIQRCTRSDPDERYPDCGELLQALSNYEKEDEAYKSKRRRQLCIFTVVFCTSVFSVVLGVALHLAGISDKQKMYEYYIKQSEVAVREEDRQELIVSAIELEPSIGEGYLALIDYYKSDGIYTESEEKCLLDIYGKYMFVISKEDSYSLIAYETGRLYRYYYYYGRESDEITAYKSSVPWFEDAVRYAGEDAAFYEDAVIQYLIGCFYRDVTTHVSEEAAPGMYLSYFHNLETLTERLGNEENDRIVLQSIGLVADSLVSYRYEFEADGVSKTNIEKLLAECDEIFNALQTNGVNDEIYSETAESLEMAHEILLNGAAWEE